jgi:23S rRNA (cytidine1920-2'-O)/16S rRNA (cytidine1409-2'-O)-methyltransferase
MTERIDKVMLERGLVKTRSQASMLITQGDVYCNGQRVTKTGHKVQESDQIEIKQDQLYVSRGAYKLKAALDEFKIDLKGKVVADVGASTGGFTQICLEDGANKVYSIDVGHDQLDPILRQDNRVINLEGTNIKTLTELPEKVDFCVVDLSFISITLVLNNILNLLKPEGKAIVLVKPQFEVGKNRISKKGLVKEEDRIAVSFELKNWLIENNFKLLGELNSPILGNKSGNVEFLWLIMNQNI